MSYVKICVKIYVKIYVKICVKIYVKIYVKNLCEDRPPKGVFTPKKGCLPPVP